MTTPPPTASFQHRIGYVSQETLWFTARCGAGLPQCFSCSGLRINILRSAFRLPSIVAQKRRFFTVVDSEFILVHEFSGWANGMDEALGLQYNYM